MFERVVRRVLLRTFNIGDARSRPHSCGVRCLVPGPSHRSPDQSRCGSTCILRAILSTSLGPIQYLCQLLEARTSVHDYAKHKVDLAAEIPSLKQPFPGDCEQVWQHKSGVIRPRWKEEQQRARQLISQRRRVTSRIPWPWSRIVDVLEMWSNQSEKVRYLCSDWPAICEDMGDEEVR
ncbi:hypothetical protein BDV96DRAFT_323641 [Lophiotrema nucula]|uniref:Uncharacterized protein n=1 Tax=Lophiotrema nucula TaxID=690887 RepID=A0A6A5ZQ18_9PLEO|nr:hypothetical protein BDV96DRAFT_323641 [Lophiotrema nucula]